MGLLLHELPSNKSEIYTRVYYGEELEFIEDLGEWVGVRYDGHEVFCDAEFVFVGPKLPTALNMDEFLYGDGISAKSIELCEFAKQFIGNPYVWGGTSLTDGADCSGFCQSVFAHFGISLPRTSREQAKFGVEVPLSKAKPGDLVFYDKDGVINHVAIYIGGGQIVNASSPKTGIRTANMYYRNPVKVVRVLEDY